MSLANRLRQTALSAVFLLAAACFGGDGDFKPAPGVTVEADALPAMVVSVLDPMGFDEVMNQSLPLEARPDGSPGTSGWDSFNRNDAGDLAQVTVLLGIDAVDAEELLQSRVADIERVSTGILRRLEEASRTGSPVAGGPCDRGANRDSDDGCAWEQRGAPDAGDGAVAHRLDVLERRASAVFFTRASLFVQVQVQGEDPSEAGDIADRIALALDDEIMQALTR